MPGCCWFSASSSSDGAAQCFRSLLIVGTNALIAMLLPYAAESFPLRIRGRTTGVVAAFSKAGGMFAQLLAVLALVAVFGKETRGRDMRDLDRMEPVPA